MVMPVVFLLSLVSCVLQGECGSSARQVETSIVRRVDAGVSTTRSGASSSTEPGAASWNATATSDFVTPPDVKVSPAVAGTVRDAWKLARGFVQMTALFMKTSSSTVPLETKWFGNLSSTARNTVRQNVSLALSTLERSVKFVYPADKQFVGTTSNFKTGCLPNRTAYVTLGSTTCENGQVFTKKCNRDSQNRKYVYVCEGLIKLDMRAQALLFIRQAIYLTGVNRNITYARDQAAALPQSEKLVNGANYEFFVDDVIRANFPTWGGNTATLPPPPARRAVRRRRVIPRREALLEEEE